MIRSKIMIVAPEVVRITIRIRVRIPEIILTYQIKKKNPSADSNAEIDYKVIKTDNFKSPAQY